MESAAIKPTNAADFIINRISIAAAVVVARMVSIMVAY